MTPLKGYLSTGTLPEGRVEAKKLLRSASRYIIQGEILYRRGFSAPLLRCLDRIEADSILSSIHEGLCGDHTGGQSLARKMLQLGYYWPAVKKDSHDFARKCDKCQGSMQIRRAPPSELKAIVKKWLGKARGDGAKELPAALWVYRTSFKTATEHTPSSLAYVSEATK